MCCSGLLKILMFIVNGAIFLGGAGLLGVGVWVTLDLDSMLGFLKFLDHIEDAPAELKQLANVGYLLIGLGTVLALIGFLGCCGVIMEKRWMLLTFFIIVLIIFIVEVAVAVVLIMFKPMVENHLQDIEVKVAASVEKTYGADEALTTLWNTTMDKLKCCGYSNYTDFTGSPFVKTSGLYPPECCKPGIQCTFNVTQSTACLLP
ncbi:tetraspanin-1-like [Sardina pilchardus]|uniref:tetraspanin-1-like n=1 Tax=Sardina pilchardus TaxID=27697 RepID=UPI002E1105CE